MSIVRLPALAAIFLVWTSLACAQEAPAAQPLPASPAATVSGPAVPAASPSATTSLAPAETTEVRNPYGLDTLWRQGDFVARGTLIILIVMSAGSWYVIVTKLIEQTRLLTQARAARKDFWTAGTVADGIERLKPGGAFRYIAETGVQASEHHEGTLVEQVDLHSWVTLSLQRALDTISTRLQGGLAFLATVGSTAPFVGLFGTVWGIYHALTAIGIAGQASIDKVAGPVGEALIMTALGLAVAVPAVLGYNWLVRRNKAALDQVRGFGADLHPLLLSGARIADAIRPAQARPVAKVA